MSRNKTAIIDVFSWVQRNGENDFRSSTIDTFFRKYLATKSIASLTSSSEMTLRFVKLCHIFNIEFLILDKVRVSVSTHSWPIGTRIFRAAAHYISRVSTHSSFPSISLLSTFGNFASTVSFFKERILLIVVSGREIVHRVLFSISKIPFIFSNAFVFFMA